MKKELNRRQRWFGRLRRHPVISGVVALGALVSAVGSIADLIPGAGWLWDRGLQATSSAHEFVSPSETLAYATNDGIYLWGYRSDSPRRLHPLTDEEVWTLRWSADGRYLSSLVVPAEPESSGQDIGTVWYRDMTTGEEGTWPCVACRGLAFVGRTLVSVGSAQGRSVLRNFSLSGGPVQVDLDFGDVEWIDGVAGRDGGPGWASVLAGDQNGALLSVPHPDGVAAYGGPELLLRADLEGRTRRVGESEALTPMIEPAMRSDGRSLAVRYQDHASGCDEPSRVAVLNFANESEQTLGVPNDDFPWHVIGVGWSDDGNVRAAMAPYRVRSAADCRNEEPFHLYEYDEGWEQVAGPDGTVDFDVSSDGREAVLRSINNDSAYPTELLVQSPIRKKWSRIARDVTIVQWRPHT